MAKYTLCAAACVDRPQQAIVIGSDVIGDELANK
jgi:hypothetical protein